MSDAHPLAEIMRESFAEFVGGDLEERRAGMDRMNPDPPASVEVLQAVVGGVPGRWVIPSGVGRRTVVHFHGGGYMTGSSYSHRDLGARIGTAGDARVFLVDYRRAPETQFPGAFEDALAVYRALVGEDGDGKRIALSGDSAGGGLALAATLALRDAGDPLPGAVVTLSAMTDMTVSGETMRSNERFDYLVTPAQARRSAETYLPAGMDPTDPRCSPLFGDFADFPPLLMQVGSSEVLLDDSLRVAEKARAEGVEVDFQPAYRLGHIYQLFAWHPRVPEAARDIEAIGKFLKARLPN
jgi:epsilon-lactone hydrolase